MSSDFHFNTPKFVGENVRQEGFRSQNEFVASFVKHFHMVAAKDSFGIIFCGFDQQRELSLKFEEEGDCMVTPIYIYRDALPHEIRRDRGTGPVNQIQLALFVRRGNPNWIKLGIIKLIVGSKEFVGNFQEAEWPEFDSVYPFQKPADLYDHFITVFSEPQHNILDAFAGSSQSVYSAVQRGRSLTLVEKNRDMEKVFQVTWDEAITTARQPLVEEEAEESENEGSDEEAGVAPKTPPSEEEGEGGGEDDSLGEQESDKGFEVPMPDSDTEYVPAAQMAPSLDFESEPEQCSSTAYPPLPPRTPEPRASSEPPSQGPTVPPIEAPSQPGTPIPKVVFSVKRKAEETFVSITKRPK